VLPVTYIKANLHSILVDQRELVAEYVDSMLIISELNWNKQVGLYIHVHGALSP
jgi:hypothetical protein